MPVMMRSPQSWAVAPGLVGGRLTARIPEVNSEGRAAQAPADRGPGTSRIQDPHQSIEGP